MRLFSDKDPKNLLGSGCDGEPTTKAKRSWAVLDKDQRHYDKNKRDWLSHDASSHMFSAAAVTQTNSRKQRSLSSKTEYRKA